MAEVPLVAESRIEHGSTSSRRLRTAGRVPGIVYGHSVEPIPVALDARELRTALSGEAGLNALFDLNIEGTHHLVIARELQRHAVRQAISHVDFQVVRRDEVISAEVPVILIGEALAVSRGDGSIEQLLQTIHVHAIPTDIPISFEVDISELEIGNSVRVGELPVSSAVTIDADPDTLIVIAHPPRTATVEGEGEGEGEGAETTAAAEGGESASAGESASS